MSTTPPPTDRERMLVDAIDGLALQFTDQDVDEMLADGYSNAEGEQKLIETLVRASERFLALEGGDHDLWSQGFSAGEHAIIALHELGLVRMVHGWFAADWTAEGRSLLRNPNSAKPDSPS